MPEEQDISKAIFKITNTVRDHIKELHSKETKLFMEFAKIYPQADMTTAVVNGIYAYNKFLKDQNYHIIHNNDLLIAPFNKFAKFKDLK